MLTRQQLIEFLGSGPRCVHFVGIGGSGMSGLARLLLQLGHRVTGCDVSANGETNTLKKLGAKIFSGHSAKHLSEQTELVVYTSAVHGENNEIQAAANLKIPAVRRGLLLTALMTHRHNIAVAGTHGKTTTTAMIAHVLTRSDSAPGFCVGAHVPVLGGSAQIGAGNYFVAEADESDGTLIGFTPEYAVCLNIEAEHLDFHGSMAGLLTTFEAFLASTLKTVFYCADCQNCVALAASLRSVISFGLSETADYQAFGIQATALGSRFNVQCRGQTLGAVELIIPGKQNVIDALAAIAVADQLGIPFDKVAAALAEFNGAKRRFERLFDGSVAVVDDYAHHPTEVRATLAAARSLGFKRIIAVFQPHRYSRTQALRDQFGSAFESADKLFVTEIYAAHEEPAGAISGTLIVDAVRASGHAAVLFEPNQDKLAERLLMEARPGDLILTLGAGDIYKVAQTVADRLTARCRDSTQTKSRMVNMETDFHALLSDRATVRRNEPMARHTSLRVGGPAEFWIEPWDERDLAKVLHYCHLREIPVTVVGRGTNLLVRDGGIAGVVVHLASDEFTKVEVDGERMIARGGTRLKALVNAAKRSELGGLEFLEGVPGSLGGALRMNAGAMGRQTFDVVEWVRYISFAGDIYDAAAERLPVTYRNCPIFTNHIVLAALLRGEKTPRARIDETLRRFERKRWQSQPAKPSAGCIFRNPEAIPAGKLIEQLGLKGISVGAARVSEVHGNFIVNEGGATARDVLTLMGKVCDRALKERAIELEPEVMILGRD